MLIGEFQHNMDAKGRLTIPVKFREDLGDKFFVCRGLDGCLFVLSEKQWEVFYQKLTSMPMSKGKNIQRYFLSGATEVELDKQGRILLPQSLREKAGLEKDCTMIGTGNKVEIWNTEAWKAFEEAQSEVEMAVNMDCVEF